MADMSKEQKLGGGDVGCARHNVANCDMCATEDLRTPQGEPALTSSRKLPGTREPVVTAPQGNAGESPASTSNNQKSNPNKCHICGAEWPTYVKLMDHHATAHQELMQEATRQAPPSSNQYLSDNVRRLSVLYDAVKDKLTVTQQNEMWSIVGNLSRLSVQPVETAGDAARDAARYRFIREQMTKKGEITYYSMPHSLMWLRGVRGEAAFDREVEARMNGATFESPEEPTPQRFHDQGSQSGETEPQLNILGSAAPTTGTSAADAGTRSAVKASGEQCSDPEHSDFQRDAPWKAFGDF